VIRPPPLGSEPARLRVGAADDSLEVYTTRLDAPARAALRNVGVDGEHLAATSARDGSPAVEVVLSGRQAGDLAAPGVALEPRIIDGLTSSQAAARAGADPEPAVSPHLRAPAATRPRPPTMTAAASPCRQIRPVTSVIQDMSPAMSWSIQSGGAAPMRVPRSQ
jgi:hypothetical protein